MNVIDKLVVTLGLDPSGYRKGAKEAERDQKKLREQTAKTAKEMEDKGKQAAAFFSKIRKEVLGLATVLVGGYGLKSFIENVTVGDAAIGRLSQNLGMTTENLSAWEGAVKRAGGSAQGMAASLRNVTHHVQTMALKGTDDLIPFLVAAHQNVAHFYKASTSMTDRLMALSHVFHGMNPARAQLLGQSLGFDEGTINLLRMAPKEIEKLIEWQKKNNRVSEKDAKLAIERLNALYNLIDEFRGLGRTLLNDVWPSIKKVADEFERWFQKNEKFIAKDITATINGIKNISQEADHAAQVFGGWEHIAELLLSLWVGAKFLKAMENVAKLSAAINRVGVGTGLLGVLGATGSAVVAGGAALAYSPGLNTGEEAELHRQRMRFGTIQRLPSSGVTMTPVAGPASNTTTTEVHIGNITVQVPSGDPNIIGQKVADSIRRHAMASQANTGMR